ncbi:MAG: hypothetical protein ACRD3E_16910 [Terriglobales bacterium]
MTTQSISYGTRTAVTCSLNSLANNSNRESNAVDNTSALAVDYEVAVVLALAASVTVGDVVTVWCAASDGTDYTGGGSGSDSSYSALGEGQLQLIGIITCVTTSAKTYKFILPSLAAFFGGAVPPKFSFIVENASGQALASSGHSIEVRSINYTYA